MFFDKVLVENSKLRRVWRAGFGRMEEPEENTSFPNLCDDLNECIGSEDPDPRRRLSLRTSSVLVEGAARIYKQELSRLIEDLSELDIMMANRDKRKSTDSEGDTSNDSSNPSTPCDTPELMRHQIPIHSDMSIQRTVNEKIKLLEAPDLSHHLSSISKSTDSPQRSRKDAENGLSAKRQKITDQTNRSSEYPSSPHLTTDRHSEGPTSDEDLDLTDDNQNILQISEQPTNNVNTTFHSDDQAARTTDHIEAEKSSEEENTRKSPDSLSFIEKIDFFAAFPNFDPDNYIYVDKSASNKNCEKIIKEADTRNRFDENVTIRKKVITDDKKSSAVKHSDRSDIATDSVSRRVDLSPILPSSAHMVLRKSRRDVGIQTPNNETSVSLKAPDLSHPLSSSKSTDSAQKSRKDVDNGLSAKRQKITDQTNRSSEYPSSPYLTTDRNSEDPISDEDLDLADDIQNILQISEQPTNNVNTTFHSDDQAARTTDHIEAEKSSKEENTPKSPVSPTFTGMFDFVFASPNYDLDTATPEIKENTNSVAYKNSEETNKRNEADTRNEFDENVTIRKKVITDDKTSCAVKRSGRSDVVKDSDSGRVDVSPILPSTTRNVTWNSRRRTKNKNRFVVKKDQPTQVVGDVSFHPNTSEVDRNANENLPFGYLLIHDTYNSRYPSKIMLSSLNPYVRNL